MQKRKLGKGNLEVSALGLGCMGLSVGSTLPGRTSEAGGALSHNRNSEMSQRSAYFHPLLDAQNAAILLPTEALMSSLQEFRCEICGTVTNNPMHWFVIQCGDS